MIGYLIGNHFSHDWIPEVDIITSLLTSLVNKSNYIDAMCPIIERVANSFGLHKNVLRHEAINDGSFRSMGVVKIWYAK